VPASLKQEEAKQLDQGGAKPANKKPSAPKRKPRPPTADCDDDRAMEKYAEKVPTFLLLSSPQPLVCRST
jgi:hypothetical protein